MFRKEGTSAHLGRRKRRDSGIDRVRNGGLVIRCGICQEHDLVFVLRGFGFSRGISGNRGAHPFCPSRGSRGRELDTSI